MKTYKIKPKTWTPINQDIEIELSEEEVKDLIEQYNKPTHKRKYFVPNIYTDYWYIDYNECEIIEQRSYNSPQDNFRISTGNCFATEQDAQDELNRRQALVRIWNNYDDKYHWDIDWEDTYQKKYSIQVFCKTNEFDFKDETYWGHRKEQTELPYFKSAEDRNQFVESNNEDLLVVFNIKK